MEKMENVPSACFLLSGRTPMTSSSELSPSTFSWTRSSPPALPGELASSLPDSSITHFQNSLKENDETYSLESWICKRVQDQELAWLQGRAPFVDLRVVKMPVIMHCDYN